MIEVAMVLCAGYGKRLRPLTDERPKPLVWVGDRTVLDHVAHRLAALGVKRIVVNGHHLRGRIEEAAAGLPLPATYVAEETILGTAGGVAGARAHLAGDVLVHNGDILADADLEALVATHRQRRPFATLAVAARKEPGEGRVGIAADGRVVRLREQAFDDEVASADFCGIQVIGPEAREELPSEGCLVGDFYLPALAQGAHLVAAPVVRGFDDIGTPGAYLAANLAWLEGGSWTGAGAEVEVGVELVDAIVHPGARVVGRGRVRRAVVWPGAILEAPAEGVIVTPRSRLILEETTAPR